MTPHASQTPEPILGKRRRVLEETPEEPKGKKQKVKRRAQQGMSPDLTLAQESSQALILIV